jgi:hypothetical protein
MAYAPGVTPGRRQSTGDRILEYVIKIVVIAVIIVFVMPYFIAPVFFGVGPEEYAQNLFLWNILAAAIAIPIAWIFARLIARSIRKGGI